MTSSFILRGASALCALALAGCAAGAALRPLGVTIETTPVALDGSAPDRAALGELQFLGGIALSSRNPAFGGLSSLRWQDGQLHALSDQNGAWFAMLPKEEGDRLVGIAGLRGIVLTEDGLPMFGERESDAEAIDFVQAKCSAAPCPATAARVALERIDRILVYKLRDGLPAGPPRRMPGIDAWLSRQTENLGVEAMASDAGEMLMVSEGLLTADGKASALLFRGEAAQGAGKGGAVEIGIPAAGEARPSEIASLGGARYLMLRRSWNESEGFRTVMELVTLQGTGADVTAHTRLLARFAPPLANDNYEGLAVRKEGGRTFVYMISDNNFSPAQRTLLLKFELVEERR